MILTRPTPENAPAFIFRLLGQQKYPASQLFLLMTLGPTIACVPLAENASGWIGKALTTFGRVPFFYYLLHIPLIHITALIVNFFHDGAMHQDRYAYAPFTSIPPESRWNLPMLYVVFVIDVFILYVACRWYVTYKFAHRASKWVKYI